MIWDPYQAAAEKQLSARVLVDGRELVDNHQFYLATRTYAQRHPQVLNKLHAAGVLPHDFVVVLRYQGPRANGMPELHSMGPLLGLLQNQGRRVALVTDGRLTGASGKFPAAIHMTPEAARGGPIGRVREGDMVRLDGEAGTLEVLVSAEEWASREVAPNTAVAGNDLGRNLFAINRQVVGPADQGAISI